MENYFTGEHLNDRAISAAVEQLQADQPDSIPAAVRDHLDACSTCRSEVAELYSIVQQATPPAVVVVSHNRWQWLGAAALLAALAMLVLWPDSPPERTPPDIPVAASLPTDTIAVPSDTLLPDTPPEPPASEKEPPPSVPATPVYAQNFVPDDMLEPLVGQHVRAGGGNAMAPNIDTAFAPGTAITFRWPTTSPGPYTLIILDNTGEQVAVQTTDATTATVTIGRRPGLYYWKVETVEDLLYVGRFTLSAPQ